MPNRPCAYCGTPDGHTPICWAIYPPQHCGIPAATIPSRRGSQPPDPEATDRAEDSYQNMMIGEGPVGPW